MAAVVALRNTGPAQAAVPVGDRRVRREGPIDLRQLDPGPRPLARRRCPRIARGAHTSGSTTRSRPPARRAASSAKVGAAKAPAPGALPKIGISKLEYGDDVSGVFARGVIANHSKIAQRRLVVSCVARRSTKVVAAGRAIVEKLQPAPTPKPVTFRVYFIGDPNGGHGQLRRPADGPSREFVMAHSTSRSHLSTAARPRPARRAVRACGAPLAADQRYCLHCGARRAERAAAVPRHPRRSERRPAAAAAGRAASAAAAPVRHAAARSRPRRPRRRAARARHRRAHRPGRQGRPAAQRRRR